MEIKKLTFFFVNAYVIKSENKTVLFDTGAVIDPAELPAYLEQNGVDPKEIDLIILSHAHWDHFQLVKAWKDLTGAPVLCHKNGLDYITTGNKDMPFDFGPKAQAYPPFIEFMMTTRAVDIPPVQPDIVIGDEGYDLHDFGFPGKVIYTPGHSDAAISLILDDGTAFTGDTVVDLHTIACLEDVYPEGTYSLNWICGDEDAIKASVKKLLASATKFLGGHGVEIPREVLESLVAE